jgi:protocatechuate 3,4-dioxygenase beta subunit
MAVRLTNQPPATSSKEASMKHNERDKNPDQTHDLGLAIDLATLSEQARRREALRWVGLVAAAVLPAPATAAGRARTRPGTATSTTTGTGTGTGTTTTSGACSIVNEETAGPYPGDGSNTANGGVANALALSGIVRSDIRSSIAGATGLATGVPVKVIIKLVNVNNSCAVLSGYAIYLWHCDAQGRYSMYSSGVTGENYLRGVQATDTSGQATFQTVFPGCYAGRMPHMHFEVYRDANTATSFSNKLKTSQLAFPNDISTTVYNGNSTYSASVANLAKMSFATDNVFSDGVTLEMTTVTGDLAGGYTATITVGISV